VDNPDHYLAANPFAALAAGGPLNGATDASDRRAGLCSAAFLWPFDVSGGQDFELDFWLPVDDFRGANDFADLTAEPADNFEGANDTFWRQKLDASGMQATLPPVVDHLWAQYRSSRADLHISRTTAPSTPGRRSTTRSGSATRASRRSPARWPVMTGWRAPSSAAATWRCSRRAGGRIGPAAEFGFFGGEHEQNDREWDANGEALWAFGKFDRIQGAATAFGSKVYWPYVLQGARWIRDNRSPDGILHRGWSAEHLGDKDQPHYWDDLWGLAGLYDAARIAERIGANEVAELWGAFDSLKAATTASIRWVLGQQRNEGQWETYVPSGPGRDRGLYSTIIGAAAYFHPTRLHYGAKLGADIDMAFRLTLDTIWSHFVEGGFGTTSPGRRTAPISLCSWPTRSCLSATWTGWTRCSGGPSVTPATPG
jgi:hypothetical protein